MAVKDELGKRMKENYENVSKTRLMKRCPVAVRIDGRAFHTFTKHFKKPFDDILIHSMQQTMKKLCENIAGCIFGYTQSDEITLILIDYQTLNTAAWFDYEVQKLCSIISSMATLYFNQIFQTTVENFMYFASKEDEKYCNVLHNATLEGAMFDARCFNIPKEEVTNLIYWRQTDATRNSIEMAGHAYFSNKELHKKNCSVIQDMLHEVYGINWNDYSIPKKRGTACFKTEHGWFVDETMPVLKGEDREYVERFININNT